MEVRMRWRSWYGDEPLALEFPDGWDVRVFPPNDGADIGDEGIQAAFASPIGTVRLSELARGKANAIIVVDDLARPTPAYRIIPTILGELRRAGIPDASIKFLMALACHRPMIRSEMASKLGEHVVKRYQVLNHHPYENLSEVGTTSRGTPVVLNRDFVDAQVRIGIGQIAPHGGPGFSGGAKIVLPGVASFETIASNHRQDRFARGLARIEGNEMRADMEEAARLAGLHLIANVVLNSTRGIAGLFVGDMIAAHRRGLDRAWEVMSTPLPSEPLDIGVFNQYPKDTEFMHLSHALHVLNSARRPLLKKGGTMVIVSASSCGFGFHSLEAPGMRHGATRPPPVYEDHRVVVMCPTVCEAERPRSLPLDARLVTDWQGVMEILCKHHPTGARVGVFPCGAIQLAQPL